VPAKIAVVLTCAKLAELRFAISFTLKYYKSDLWVENRGFAISFTLKYYKSDLWVENREEWVENHEGQNCF